MAAGQLAPFVVHVAGAPVQLPASADALASALQRCVSCGLVLIDNTPWLTGDVAVPEGDAGRGPSWWETGALVATDKAPGSTAPSCTYTVERGRSLDDDERPCVTP